MTSSLRSTRPVLLVLIVFAMASATSGCHWVRSHVFHSKSSYEDSKESHPLEVPPDLDTPVNNGSMQIPAANGDQGGMPMSGQAMAPSGVSSFTVSDSPDSVWKRMGLALERIDGVTISGRAEALNSYDVSYQGTTLLVRAAAQGDQTVVSAVAADGTALSGGPGTVLLALLKARLN